MSQPSVRDKVETWFKENERLSQDEPRSHHSRSRDAHSVRSSRRGSEHDHHQNHDHAPSIKSGHSGHSSHRRRRKRRSSNDGESGSSHATPVIRHDQYPVDIKLVAGWLEVIGNLEAAQAAYAHYTEYRRRRSSKRQKKKKKRSLPSIMDAIRMLKAGAAGAAGSLGSPLALHRAAMMSTSQLSQSWVSEVDLANSESSSRRRRHRHSSRDEMECASVLTAADAKRHSRTRDASHLDHKGHRRSKHATRQDSMASLTSVEPGVTRTWSRVVDELVENSHAPDTRSSRRGGKCPGCRTCNCDAVSIILPTVPEDGTRPTHADDPIKRSRSPLVPSAARAEGRRPSALTLPQTIRLAALLKQREQEKWARAGLEKTNAPSSPAASVYGSAYVREKRVHRLLKATRPSFNGAYKRAERARLWGV